MRTRRTRKVDKQHEQRCDLPRCNIFLLLLLLLLLLLSFFIHLSSSCFFFVFFFILASTNGVVAELQAGGKGGAALGRRQAGVGARNALDREVKCVRHLRRQNARVVDVGLGVAAGRQLLRRNQQAACRVHARVHVQVAHAGFVVAVEIRLQRGRRIRRRRRRRSRKKERKKEREREKERK